MKIKKIIFPYGAYGAKARWLAEGFRILGYEVRVGVERKVVAVPFRIVFTEKREVACCLDISVKKDAIVKEMWNGRYYYFKTHLNPLLMLKYPRLYPIPQAMAHVEYLAVLRKLRKEREKREAEGQLAPDVFGVFAYAKLRMDAVRIVKQMNVQSVVGINKKEAEGEVPEDLRIERMDSGEYMRTMAISKLALAFPSYGGEAGRGPWASFRHVEAWALGVPVVTTKPMDYLLPGEPNNAWIEVRKDLTDLKEKIEAALKDDALRKEIGKRGRRYFEQYFRPEHHAQYVLGVIEDEEHLRAD
jgi:hypothetical protein